MMLVSSVRPWEGVELVLNWLVEMYLQRKLDARKPSYLH